tara:strand:+ start:23 stop:493 length:471 start_codon:yes stop_codon:yes gene_type:complete
MINNNTIQPLSCHGEKVEVYRNLHKNCFSVRRKGKVVGYIYDDDIHRRDVEIYLTNVKFVVQPAGRCKVLRERKKNVHAFVRGIVTPFGGLQREILYKKCYKKVTYDPYKMSTFQDVDGNNVYEADDVLISKGTVYVSDKFRKTPLKNTQDYYNNP